MWIRDRSVSVEGLDQVVFHFGRVAEGGSVRVSSASVLEAVSGESLSVVSESVSVSAGRSGEVSGGESVSGASGEVPVAAWRSLEASAASALVTVSCTLCTLSTIHRGA